MSSTQRRFNKTANKFKAWVSNYIPLFDIDAITYPCRNPDAGLAILIVKYELGC